MRTALLTVCVCALSAFSASVGGLFPVSRSIYSGRSAAKDFDETNGQYIEEQVRRFKRRTCSLWEDRVCAAAQTRSSHRLINTVLTGCNSTFCRPARSFQLVPLRGTQCLKTKRSEWNTGFKAAFQMLRARVSLRRRQRLCRCPQCTFESRRS